MISEGIVLNICCGLCFASLGVVLSLASSNNINIYSYYFLGSLFAFTGSAVLVVEWQSIPEMTRCGELVMWMSTGSIFNCLGHLLLFFNMKHFHKGASWAIAMSALIIPYSASTFIWGEQVTLSGICGCIIIIIGIIGLSIARKDSAGARKGNLWLLSSLANFVCYGLAQICMGVPSHWEHWLDSANLRSPLSALLCAVFMFIVMILNKQTGYRKTLVYGIVYSVIYLTALCLIFKTLDILSVFEMSKIFWPLGSGVCIFSFCIYSHIRFREKFSRLDVCSIIILLCGLILISDLIY